MNNTRHDRALAAIFFAAIALSARAADDGKPVEAFASHPSHCSQFQGGEKQAGDAVEGGYAASLSAGLSSSMSGNSRDAEAALRSVADACAASAPMAKANGDSFAPK